MSDNNRLELDIVAVDQTAQAANSVKARYDSMAADIARSAQKMTGAFDAPAVNLGKSFDQGVKAAMSSIDRLEARAALAGKSGVERLIGQRTAAIGRLGSDEAGIQRVVSAYDKLISARQKYEAAREKGEGGGNPRQLLYGLKDLSEGYTRGATIRSFDYLFGQGNSSGALTGVIDKVSEFTGLTRGAVIGATAVAAAIAALGFAGVKAMSDLAEKSKEFENLSAKTGIAPDRIQAFQFAAKASGAGTDVLERLTRGLAQIADDSSSAGNKARQELGRLGVNIYDQFGDLKPTEQILLAIGAAVNKLPPGLQQTAASMELVKRAGVDAVPFLKDLHENLQTSDSIGLTFSKEELDRFEKWHQDVARMGEEWGRLKLLVEEPLAISVRFIGQAAEFFIGVGDKIASPFRGILTEGLTLPHPAVPTAADAQRFADRYATDTRIRQFQAEEDPFGIESAKAVLSGLTPDIVGHTSREDEARYEAAKRAVDRAEEAKKAALQSGEDQIALTKQRLALQSQLAQVEEESAIKETRASTDRKQGLISEIDLAKELALVRQRVSRETEQAIGERRYRVDDKTGAVVDLSGTPGFQKFAAGERGLEGLRTQVETAKVLSDYAVQSDEHFRNQRNAIFAPDEAQQKNRQEAERAYNSAVQREQKQAAQQYYRDQETELGRERDLALQNVDFVNAQTLKEKAAVEDQKLAIEETYTQRSLSLQLQRIESERAYEEGDLQRKARLDGSFGSDAYNADKAAVDARYDAQRDALTQSSYDRELTLAQQTANAKAKMEIEANQRVFDEMKRASDGFVDALFSKDPGASLKKWLTNLGEGLVKQVISSQLAGSLTEIVTGNKVSFDPLNSGGRAGDVLGRLGLGRPRFGQPQVSKLDLPNHLGDVQLVSSTDGSTASNSVPVVITNYAQLAQTHAETAKAAQAGQSVTPRDLHDVVTSTISYAGGSQGGGSYLPAVVAGLGTLAAATGAAASTATKMMGAVGGTATSINLGGIVDGTSLGPVTDAFNGINFGSFGNLASGGADASSGGGILSSILGGGAASGGSGGGFLGGILGGGSSGSGGGLLGGLFGGSSSGSGGSGILGGLLGGGSSGSGILGGLKGLLGQNVSGVDLGNGIGIANTGALGHLAAFGQSGLAGSLGIGLALNGIQRGGVGGTLEAAGGGALAGFKFGGPIGAAIGAVVGAGAALIKTEFFTSDTQHAKNLVKQVYGLSINDATANQIVQIAKQSYGGQIDVAVRSEQVRQLLKLYAEATGSKSQAQFVADTPHAASLVEANGKLLQNAVYDNGNAYSYSSSLGTYGGIQTTPLPTYAPNTGGGNIGSLQLVVNGQSASDLLAGQVANVATPGFIQSQSIAGSSASIGRMQQTALTLAPSAITR